MSRRLPNASLDVVLPAFNEAANLPALFARLRGVLPALTPHWRLLLIDDGSSDDTAAVAQAAIAAGLPLRYVKLSRNFGKEAALTAGLALADADCVLLMDADGQHAPDLIAQMHQAWMRGADMACAVRAHRDEEGPLKRWGTRLFYGVVNASTRTRIPPDAGDFRLLDRRVVQALNALPERNRFMKGLYAWVGFRTEFLPYEPLPRTSGRSHFSSRGLLRLAFTGVTAFSNLPLRIWSALGGAIAVVALAYGLWIVVEHLLYGHPLPGWPTLVVGLMFFSGVQLLSIGIIGEYVGRIFDEVKQRPVYLVAQDTGNPA
ncbi:glycosyltransferase family 2 protein [Roseateles cellulosilyticus]|uniref:Glycosyltransferase family 2 protein n=1 Tax=Pelomonas cellulosilytica TaxID=2906762 RepID=A0ABS8XTS8_9BURK|nr:glycosyltransferase family 2 protein [Pelomonas sp. P8]MCE4554084.1 glycosyltransferase family 2 protein [Pelomonas sp. P8]